MTVSLRTLPRCLRVPVLTWARDCADRYKVAIEFVGGVEPLSFVDSMEVRKAQAIRAEYDNLMSSFQSIGLYP